MPLKERLQHWTPTQWLIWHSLRVLAILGIGFLIYECIRITLYVYTTRQKIADDYRMAKRVSDRDCHGPLAPEGNAHTQTCREAVDTLAQHPTELLISLTATRLADDVAALIPFGTLCRQSEKACLVTIIQLFKSLVTWTDLALWICALLVFLVIYVSLRNIFTPAIRATKLFLAERRAQRFAHLIQTQRAYQPIIEEIPDVTPQTYPYRRRSTAMVQPESPMD